MHKIIVGSLITRTSKNGLSADAEVSRFPVAKGVGGKERQSKDCCVGRWGRGGGPPVNLNDVTVTLLGYGHFKSPRDKHADFPWTTFVFSSLRPILVVVSMKTVDRMAHIKRRFAHSWKTCNQQMPNA